MKESPKAQFIYAREFEKYSYPDDCPFKSSRAGLTRQIARSMGLFKGKSVERKPEPADRSIMEKFHASSYLDALKAAQAGKLDSDGFAMGLGTPDCPVFKGMYEYAALACGGTLVGAQALLNKEADMVFNPSGGYHHAGPDTASGFCYINDVVLGCTMLAEQGARVAFVDVDVHHCDGVQTAFYARRDVMTISLHESGKTLFPGTGFEDEIGEGEGRGYSVNVPLPVGTYDGAYTSAFRQVVLPLLDAYSPDVVVVEAGMDGLAGDPLAHLHLTNNAYAEVLELLLNFKKPMLVTGGGGYHVENTARAWALLWSILCDCGKQDDMALGLGGVMLETTDWHGGLRDRPLVSHGGQRAAIDTAISATVEAVKKNVFPLHGL